MKSMLQNHLKEIRQQFAELRNEIHMQNQIQFQEVSKLLGNQATVTAVMIRNELLGVLGQFGAGANDGAFYNVPNVYDDFPQPSAGNTGQFQKSNGKQKQKQTFSYDCHQSDNLDSIEDVESIFPVQDGAVLHVKDVSLLATSGEVTASCFYILPDCPCKVQLTVWFGKKGNVQAQLSIFGIMKQSLKQARIFTVTGHIVNKNSGSFSPLFEGTSLPFRRLRPNKEMVVRTLVCLKTGSGAYEDVTLDELERRTFIINNSIIIKWFVTSEEAQADEERDV